MYWRILVRVVLLSMILSAVSLLTVTLFPTRILITEADYTQSPYIGQIDELLEEGRSGLTPAESKRLMELIEKNNDWFANQHLGDPSDPELVASFGWKEKNRRLSILIIMIWVGSFLLLCYRGFERGYLVILVSPVVLYLFQLMTLGQMIAVNISMLAIWIWFFWRSLSIR